MKRWPLLATLLLGVSSALPGCPIYADDDARCVEHSECAPGYACDFPSGECRSVAGARCDEPSDCDGNQTCSRSGRCRVGDCTFPDIGCVAGTTCAAPNGRWQCVADDGAGAAAGQGGSGAASGAGAQSGSSAEGGTSAEGGASTVGGTSTGGVGAEGGSASSGEGGVANGGAPESAGAAGESAGGSAGAT